MSNEIELKKIIGRIKRNTEKMTKTTWKMVQEQILDHIERAELLPDEQPSSPMRQDDVKQDWTALREKFFKECTYKPESGLIMSQHSLPPHDVFKWFMQQIKSTSSQTPENEQDELIKKVVHIAMDGLLPPFLRIERIKEKYLIIKK